MYFMHDHNQRVKKSIKCSFEEILFLKNISLFPIKAINIMLRIVITSPTYEKSKKLKPELEIVALYSEIIIFGGVPIAVFIPPKIQANAKGIKNFEGCQSILWHMFKVIGNTIASAPILFIKDDKAAAIKRRLIKN